MGMVLPNSLDKKWLAYASHYHINILTSISENWCLWNNSILCSKNEREQSTCLAICVFSLCLLQISLLFTSPKLITSENQHSWVCGLFESRIVSYTCLDNPLGCKHMSYSTIIAFLDLYLHWQKRCGTYFTICTEEDPNSTFIVLIFVLTIIPSCFLVWNQIDKSLLCLFQGVFYEGRSQITLKNVQQ